MELSGETNVSVDSDGRLTEEGYLATGIYVMFVGLTGTVGNSMVILVIIKSWSNSNIARKPHLPLTLSLALSDLGITFFGYPYTSISGFAGHWVFNDGVCKMAGFFCFCLSMASLDILTAISVYRYIAICRPELKVRLTKCVTSLVILFCWAYALVWTVPPLFGLSGYTYEPFKTACSMDWASRRTEDVVFLLGTDIFCFLVHLIILIFCYTKIFLRYRYLTNPSDGSVRKTVMNREMRVTWMAFSNVVIFVLVWSPYAVVCTWMVIADSFPAKASVLPTMFAKSSCAFNPILYGAFDTKFRQLAKRIFCPYLFKNVHPTNKYGGYLAKLPRQRTVFCISPTKTTNNDPASDQSDKAAGNPSHSKCQLENSSVVVVKANVENDSNRATAQQYQHRLAAATCGMKSAVPFVEPGLFECPKHQDVYAGKSYLMSAGNKALVKSLSATYLQSKVGQSSAPHKLWDGASADSCRASTPLLKEAPPLLRQHSFPKGSTEEKYAAGYDPSGLPSNALTPQNTKGDFTDIRAPVQTFPSQSNSASDRTALSNQALSAEAPCRTLVDYGELVVTPYPQPTAKRTSPVLHNSEGNFHQSDQGLKTSNVFPERVFRYSYNLYSV